MHALREAVAAVRRAPLLTALSAAMVALALYVVGLFALATYNLHEALGRVEERVEVVVYVQDGTSSEQVALLEADLRGMGEVESVEYHSKEEALAQARVDLPELFDDVETNPLPASLEIALEPDSRTPAGVARVAERAEGYPFVEEARFGREWVDRLYMLRRIGAIATAVLGSAFTVVAALIIATAVRIALFARREEIYVMRLVGATNGFIRRPFLLEGALTGVAGGMLAVVLTFVSHAVVSRAIFRLEWIPAGWVTAGVAAGGLFGLVASAFAIRRYLREV